MERREGTSLAGTDNKGKPFRVFGSG
jgi:hypothetical protein